MSVSCHVFQWIVMISAVFLFTVIHFENCKPHFYQWQFDVIAKGKSHWDHLWITQPTITIKIASSYWKKFNFLPTLMKIWYHYWREDTLIYCLRFDLWYPSDLETKESWGKNHDKYTYFILRKEWINGRYLHTSKL